VLNDYPVFLVAAAIGLYALFKLPEWKSIGAFSAGALLTAAILLAYKLGRFRKPACFSATRRSSSPTTAQFPEQAVGFVRPHYPKARILWNVLLDPQRGLSSAIRFAAIDLGVAYFARLRQWRAEFVVTVIRSWCSSCSTRAYGESIVSWGGGTATGPRQIVASVPFMVFALAFLPAASNFILGAFGAISAAIMLMATATNPHFRMSTTIRSATSRSSNSCAATSRPIADAFFGGGMIVGDSVAFNLGKSSASPHRRSCGR